MTDIEVRDHPDAHHYEATIDGKRAGVAEYQLTDQLIVFTHTEVDPAYEGLGVGSALVRAALDAVRADGTRQVLPICPFVKTWIGKHQEYGDLLYGARRSNVTD